VSTAPVSASPHEVMSIRSARPSFHSAVTGSGAGPGVRRLASTLHAPFCTSWCSRAADPSSRKWASSTTRSSFRSGPARSRMASLVRRNSPSRSPGECPASGRNGANGPNGMAAAARDATACAVVKPSAVADLAASAANRVLPTPAAPANTNAAGSGRFSFARIQSISVSRDTRGISPVSVLRTLSSFAFRAYPCHSVGVAADR